MIKMKEKNHCEALQQRVSSIFVHFSTEKLKYQQGSNSPKCKQSPKSPPKTVIGHNKENSVFGFQIGHFKLQN